MNKSLLIVSTVAAFLFASCDNENTTNPEPLGTVTIKGAIVSNIDEKDTDGVPLEKIPAGVAVYFIDDDSEALLATATTTADGYSQDLQIAGPRTIKIVIGDFETDINVQVDTDQYEEKHAVYNSRQDFLVDVVKGGTYIENIEIFQPTANEF